MGWGGGSVLGLCSCTVLTLCLFEGVCVCGSVVCVSVCDRQRDSMLFHLKCLLAVYVYPVSV